MWHYILTDVSENTHQDPKSSEVFQFIRAALHGAGLNTLTAREPYFHSAAQAASGIFDGVEVGIDLAVSIVISSTLDDASLPSCKFDGPGGQYLHSGMDDEVYLGLNVRQEPAEEDARRRKLTICISDAPSPYLQMTDVAADPALDDTAWLHITRRVEREKLFALERWANGPYGETGYVLRQHDDVTRLASSLHPRAGLALFSAESFISVETAQEALSKPTSQQTGAGPENRLVYQTNDQQAFVVADFHGLRDLERLLTGAPPGSKPLVFVAPTFTAWHPPTVETYVCPDSDGVIRSGLGYHLREQDD